LLRNYLLVNCIHVYIINLSDAETLGKAYGRGGVYPVDQQCDLLQWAVGLQQQWRRWLFFLKTEVATQA